MRLLVLLAAVAVAVAGCAAPPAGPKSSAVRSESKPRPRPKTVKVAAVQCPSVLADVAGNTKRLTRLVRKAAAAGAKIVVLPEAAITGYLSQDLKRNWHLPGRPLAFPFQGVHPGIAAEPVPGPSTRHFAKLAGELGVYVTVPLIERDVERDGARYFNTVALVSPAGTLVAHYRKLTPWPHPEQSWATPGDLGTATYDTEYGRVGLAICFDIHTILDKYRDRELWALLYPIAWVDDSEPIQWFTERLPARVRKAGIFLIGANWSVERKQPWHGYGYSTILGTDGDVLASSDTRLGESIIYATLPTQPRNIAVRSLRPN